MPHKYETYRAQAKARLEASSRAGKLVRLALKAFWTPVGAGPKSEQEVDALALYLFGDSPEGREGMREIDRTIQDIPGLEGLTLLEDTLDRALDRAARTPGWGGVAPAAPRDKPLAGTGPEARSTSQAAA